MTTPNHLAGGFVFTGVFASLAGYNILESIPAIAVTLIASVLPDIDHPSSITGKVVLPISKYINAKFGHRTLTHSLLGFAIFTILFATLNNFLFPQYSLTFIAATSYLSHILIDMTTRAGVILFYPFLKNSCVMPGKPEMRFKTGEAKSEIMVFSFFLVMGIFIYPLMSTGFWTQYNRLFGTPAHLVSEFEKSSDLLLVSWKKREGSNDIEGQGYCVNAESATKIYLIDRVTERLEKLEGIVLETVPEHTNKQLVFENVSFVNIGLDSLNTILSNHYFRSVQIVANDYFFVSGKKTKTFKDEWLNSFLLREVVDTIAQKEFIYETNPRIAVLRESLQVQRNLYDQMNRAYQEYKKQLSLLETELSETEDLVNRQLLLEQKQSLLKAEPSFPDHTKIKSLEVQIDALVAANAIKNQKSRNEVETFNLANQHEAVRFTGTCSIIQINTVS